MRSELESWQRECPECKTWFDSVQATGICPSCNLVFDVHRNGSLSTRGRKIGDSKRLDDLEPRAGVRRIRSYVTFLNDAKINSEEFNYNVLLAFIAGPQDDWNSYACMITNEIASQFTIYLSEFLIPLQYRPSPACFMIRPFDNHAVVKKMDELEPIYRELHRFWLNEIHTRGITTRCTEDA